MNLEELLKTSAECPHMTITIKEGRVFMESNKKEKEPEITITGIPKRE